MLPHMQYHNPVSTMTMSLVIILLATSIAIFAIQLLRFDKVFQSSSERRGCLGEKERRALNSWKLQIPGNGYPCGTSGSPINSYPWALPELPVELCVVKTSKSNPSHPYSNQTRIEGVQSRAVGQCRHGWRYHASSLPS